MALRESTSATQQDVADRIGVTSQYYQMIEAGRRQADLSSSMVDRLAAVFGKSVEEIHEMEMAYQAERARVLEAQGM